MLFSLLIYIVCIGLLMVNWVMIVGSVGGDEGKDMVYFFC